MRKVLLLTVALAGCTSDLTIAQQRYEQVTRKCEAGDAAACAAYESERNNLDYATQQEIVAERQRAINSAALGMTMLNMSNQINYANQAALSQLGNNLAIIGSHSYVPTVNVRVMPW